MKKSIILIASVLYSIHIMAQNITGKVSDEKNIPLEFVNVVLLNTSDSTFIQGAISKSDGTFEFPNIGNKKYILKASSVGYITVFKYCNSDDVCKIMLSADAILLNETTITAQKQSFKSEQGAIVANVSNSILSRETSTTDVLRKIPGMMMQDDKPISFIGGEPLIYINGKKALDYSSVKSLPVKDIKTIKLITNPGARYDASTGAVLLITTKKNLKGLSVQLDGDIRRNHFWSHNENLDLKYAFKKLTMFASLGYEDTRKKNIENAYIINHGENIYDNYLNTASKKSSDKTTDYSIGFNYQINDKHQIGIEYSGWTEKNNNLSSMNDSTLLNSVLYDKVLSTSNIKDKKDLNHVNAFYTGDFSKRLSFSLYADYLNNHSTRHQAVEENAETTGGTFVESNSKSDFDIYAAKGTFDYGLGNSQWLSIGGEYSKTNGTSSLKYTDGFYNSDYKTEESKIAGFAEYSVNIKPLSINAGIRYEHVNREQTDYIDDSKNISRNHSNLYPSLTISYASKIVRQSLSYRASVKRPSFSWLSTASTYVNRYQRQIGNPALQPQTSHVIQYSLMYKFLFAQASYTYNKDYIGLTLLQDAQDQAVTLSSWKNYDHEQVASLVLGARYKWNFYEPSLTIGMQKHFFKTEYLGENKSFNKPIAMINLNNGLHLPCGFFANIEYMFISSGNNLFMTIKPMHIFNVSVQKSFFKNRLAATFKATDLFAKNVTRVYGGIGNIHIDQYSNRDNRAVSLHITWRFNSNKKSYKGKNAAQEEMRRL